ncbi:hypothetical protein HG535_0F00250 [Zygotorulaspora mrakii]|uniref:DNA mismatch repair protein MSH3 n=1 Tax=Zygotorulaspora mrakii TaxID=42260 RepID=A0A7H9B4A4_ZYGMR|nr:uncharacterized protein HG535_0F00250 [Zygotorulaspora mrakii]QLG73515.1 hypothetical protein HG535_0F00250 [Zygotorulaspora mrakii]
MAGQPSISKFFKQVKINEYKTTVDVKNSAGRIRSELDSNADKMANEGGINPQTTLKDNIPQDATIKDCNMSNKNQAREHVIVDVDDSEEEGHSTAFQRKRTLPNSFDTAAYSNNVIIKPKRQTTVNKFKDMKLTPLDQQIKELKESHLDKLLVVRVGYKYKCFAQDAVIASQILQIKLIAGKLTFDNSNPQDEEFRQFAYCSFPDTRLNVHLERLVHHDLKVGVVEQSETTAIKKYSKDKNKSNVFQRNVTNTFSKATYGINNTFSPRSGPILGENNSIWALSATVGPEKSRSYALISVNFSKGEVVYDSFQETSSSLEKLITRLSYLEPKEVVSDGQFTIDITQCLRKRKCIIHESISNVTPNLQISETCEKLKMNEHQLKMVDLLYHYIKSYGNEQILLLSSTYKPFVSNTHMLLTSNTIQSLDIFSNEGGKGSLFWVLDHTRTSFGSRELKEWISKPLVNRSDIEDRLDAIQCIKGQINNLFFESLNRVLKSSPDLLRTLNRIAYGNTSRKEVYYFLKQLALFANHFETHANFLHHQLESSDGKIRKNSRLLTRILTEMRDYSKNSKVTHFLSMINVSAILEKDMEKQISEYFNLNNYDHSETLIQRQRQISAVKEELMDELVSIRKLLRRPHMDYKDAVDYLIEVRNTQIKDLPSDWVKVNDTKMVSRFHTPTTSRLVEKLQYHKDLLLHEADEEFHRFLSRIKKEYSNLRSYLQNYAVYDAILSLAATSCNQGYVRPVFTSKKQCIKSSNARNPVIESLDVSYVPNDINMNEEDGKVLVLTGPNMGGKSSYVRKVALLVILAQIGSFVPADYFEVSIFDSMFTRIGAYDDILRGQSTFKVEMLDIMRILEGFSKTSLLLLDEVGRGTSTEDGKAIAFSLLKYFIGRLDCPLILFTTHYPSLAGLSSTLLKNYYMDYEEQRTAGESWSSVVFLYKLRPGTARNSFGMNVAKLAGIDKNIINTAFTVSECMRKESISSEKMALSFQMKKVMSSNASSNEKLVKLLHVGKQENNNAAGCS